MSRYNRACMDEVLNSPVDAFAMPSGAFCDAAFARGVARGRAMDVYRAIHRQNAPAPPWAHVPTMAVQQVQHEVATIKFTQSIDGALESESVILPQRSRAGRERNTLCLSSQIGCAMGCTFCETAQMGLMKNLSVSQIVAQWHAARHHFGVVVTNLVFMGMGEPMDNADAVAQAVRVFTDHNGPGIASSRITISTVGRCAGIRRLATLVEQPGFRGIGLAVSVNAPNDAVRSTIMPINRAEPMAELRAAIAEWCARLQTRVLIEYVLIPGVNDGPDHPGELCEYLRGLPATVNVIPYNPRRDSPWPAPDESMVNRFVDEIKRRGQLVKRRQTMGRTLMAACGQLGSASVRKRRLVMTPITMAGDTAAD